MAFHRSIMLSLILLSTLTFGGLSAQAQDGELAAQDVNAQVNLRSLANTEAEIVTTGKVGDRVQILSSVTNKDGQTWYRVKVLQSGKVGWVRGDLMKVLGSAKTIPSQKPVSKATLKGPSSKSAPVSIKTPKAVATPPKSAPQSKPIESPTVLVDPAIAPSSVIILAFKTPTYAVRIFSKAGHLQLNLFNRKSQQLVLEAVPVESKHSDKITTYSYSSDIKVTVILPTQGSPTLTTVALGNTLQEGPEISPPPASATDVTPKKIVN